MAGFFCQALTGGFSRVANTGSYEIRFPDGRPSRFIYWDNIPACGCGPTWWTAP